MEVSDKFKYFKMNCKIKIPRISVLFLISLFLLIASCKKSTIPSVTTATVNRIQQTNAYSGGQITDDGGAHISQLGVCWNTSADPTISNNKTQDTLGIAQFIKSYYRFDTKYNVLCKSICNQ